MQFPYLLTKKRNHKKQVVISRTGFISRMFKTDTGVNFLFKSREYLKPIYNTAYRYLVILASRQAEKSSFISKDMLCDALLNSNDSLLYVTALQRHSDEFVRRKINRQFELNPQLQQDYLGLGSIDNVRDKILLNGTTLTFRPVGQSADSARGIPARKIYFDEVQSIEAANIDIVSECAQSFPDDSAYTFAGTPLSTKNVLSQKYYKTKQFEYLISCTATGCSKRNPPLGIEHIDPQKPFLFCCYCGREMDVRNGEWVAMNPESTLNGYRICRLMTPTCTWNTSANDGVLDKLKTYSDASFHQEVLGLPYDSGTLPITEEEVLACCDPNLEFIDPFNPDPSLLSRPLFIALDWAWNTQEGGQSFTAMAIGALRNQKIEILFMKRFQGMQYHNPDTVLNEIAQIADRIKAPVIGSDYGIGHKENKRLQEITKSRVFEFLYVNSGKEYSWDDAANCYKVGRTATLDLVFTRIKKGLYILPKREQIMPFASDLLNVFAEYDPNFKRVRYEHAGTGPDDALHLYNYVSILIESYYHMRIR